jgi:hypothetical protein
LLAAAFARPLPAAAAAHMDGRVAAAIELRRVPAVTPARPRLQLPSLPLRRRLRPLAFALAALVLVGAAAAYVDLFAPTVERTAGWRLGWERAGAINLSEQAGPYTLTLQRAYADANQVLVGVTVVAPKGAVPVELAPDYALADSTGRRYDPYFAGGYPDANALGVVIGFLPEEPRAPGRLVLALTVRLEEAASAQAAATPGTAAAPMPGPVTFRFPLDVRAGGVLVPVPSAAGSRTAGGYTLRLESASISATMVRARLRVSGPELQSLSPIGSVTLDGRTLGVQAFPAEIAPGSWLFELTTLEGSDHPSGTLDVRIETLTGAGTDGTVARVEGPWPFALPVPGP